MTKVTDPKSVIYILCHALVFAIGIILCITGKVVLVAIGTSLIAAGVAGWVVYSYVLSSQRVSEALDIIQHFGFLNAFEGRQVRIKPYYDNLLEKANDRIDIMGFGLKALREDYLQNLHEWKQKAHVRILIIDPEFPTVELSYSQQRDLEEKDDSGTISQQVRKFITETRDIRNSPSGHAFEIRLYRCLPSTNIFRVDGKMFWGPYLIKEPSRNSPTFLVRKGGVLFDRLLNHFESIWSDDSLSRQIPEEW